MRIALIWKPILSNIEYYCVNVSFQFDYLQMIPYPKARSCLNAICIVVESHELI